MRWCVPLLLTLGLCSAVLSAESHPFSVRDMLAMDRISDPRVSPDGKQVVFVVRTTDLEANKGRNDLYLLGADGSGPRRLTSHEASDTSPRFAPDGKSICFLSTRSGSTQIWRIAPDGGEAQKITDLPLDVGTFALSRSSRTAMVSSARRSASTRSRPGKPRGGSTSACSSGTGTPGKMDGAPICS